MSETNFIPDGNLPAGETPQLSVFPGNPGGVTSPPVLPNSYASLETARLYLTEWDDFALAMALQAASQVIADWLGIEYMQQQTIEVYQVERINKKFLLNRGPINNIISVQMLAANRQTILATWASTGYYWDQKFLTILPGGSGNGVTYNQAAFWHHSNTFQITYDAGYVLVPTTGYTTMPQAIQLATVYTAKAMLMARTADFNTSGESAAGAYSIQYLVGSIGNIPPTAMAMLQPYKRTAVW